MRSKKLKALAIFIFVATVSIISYYSFWLSSHKVIYKTKTDFGLVWIFERELSDDTMRCMSFIKPPPPAVQSCYLKKQPDKLIFAYSRGMVSTLLFNPEPKKVLLIGLGGASIVNALNKISPNTQIDIVEINPDMSRITRDYFHFDANNANNTVHVIDGAKYVKNTADATYDIVMLDAFASDYIPKQFLTNEFMQDVKRILVKDGIFTANTFEKSKFTEVEGKLFAENFESHYSMIYQQSKIIVTSNSQIGFVEDLFDNAVKLYAKFNYVGIDIYKMIDLYQRSRK